MSLTEEQKNLTLGQVEEMKGSLQKEIAEIVENSPIREYYCTFSFRKEKADGEREIVAVPGNLNLNIDDVKYFGEITPSIMDKINNFRNATGFELCVNVDIVYPNNLDINGNVTCNVKSVVVQISTEKSNL